VDLIYIDPPFFTGTDQKISLAVPDSEEFLLKEPSIIEEAAYRNVWKDGSVKGLRVRGGFEIEDMEWKNGIITKLVIKSTIGGNCRLRSYSQLKSNGKEKLKKVIGENSNPFYQIPEGKTPLVSKNAKLKSSINKKSFVYDLTTNPGTTYRISGI